MRRNIKAIKFAIPLAVHLILMYLPCYGQNPFPNEQFEVGCNYWASHAGMFMWRNWDAGEVEKDLDLLASQGLTVLRVFPLWPDFQPLTAEYGGAGSFRGFSQDGKPLRNYAGVDDEMIERFRFLCRAAERRKIKLVVGLITGWMSGRMFVPPALERLSQLTDPASIMWQVRFVRYFIERLKDEKSIIAWDLGNECNSMGNVDGVAFWAWMHQIVSEIRLSDSTRPVVSGMHSLGTRWQDKANMRQQHELVDVLTTHPYPLWTPNCNVEPFDGIVNGCHAACQSVYYSDLSGKPCFVEEAGSMGPGIVSEKRAAASMRTALFSCWAAGISAYCWWCAFDQDNLEFAPYEWTAIERELGLFSAKGEAKPTARQLGEFASFLKTLPFSRLPKRQIDAVVVVTEREEAWSSAQGAWLLAKKAGFDISYALAEGELPDSRFYILPSGSGYETYSGSAYKRIRQKVCDGATVLITLGNGAVLSGLKDFAGIETENHYRESVKSSVVVEGCEFDLLDSYRRLLSLNGAEVVAADRNANPMLTVHAYGKGKVVYCNAAIERVSSGDAWPIYAHAAKVAGVQRCVTRLNPMVGVTEHKTEDGRAVVVAVNYAPTQQVVKVVVRGEIGTVWRGQIEDCRLSLPANDAAVFEVLAIGGVNEGVR